MGLKEKIENGISEYISYNSMKPQLLILHPGVFTELARELTNEVPLNTIAMSAFFGLRIVTSSDLATEEIILAK